MHICHSVDLRKRSLVTSTEFYHRARLGTKQQTLTFLRQFLPLATSPGLHLHLPLHWKYHTLPSTLSTSVTCTTGLSFPHIILFNTTSLKKVLLSNRASLLFFPNIFIYNFDIFLLSSIQHYAFWFPKFSLIIASKSLQKLCTDKRELIYTIYTHTHIYFVFLV